MTPLDRTLKRLRLERALNVFRPVLIGPHAVGMARDGDTIEVRCQAPDMERFHARLTAMYETLPGFSLTEDGCTIALQPPVNIVASAEPSRAQVEVRRHFFLVRLIRSLGPQFAQRLKGRRRSGLSLYQTAAEIMGVEDILEAEGDNLVALRDRWRGTRRRAPQKPPPPPKPAPAPEAEAEAKAMAPEGAPAAPVAAAAPAEAEAAPAEAEESLLRQPSALLMRRDSRWVNAAIVLARRGRSGMELAKPPRRDK